MAWTQEQARAIHLQGTNILVSAGAGSGKTAVLTERLLEKAKKGQLKRLLVLTFTNAAAAEMRDRIRTKILENKELHSQLDALDSAYFTTFDSYALSVVKQYPEVVGIDPQLTLDGFFMTTIARRRIINQIFETAYVEKNTEYLQLIDRFSVTSDDLLQTLLFKLSMEIESKVAPLQYLDDSIAQGVTTQQTEDLFHQYESLIHERMTQFYHWIETNDPHYQADYWQKLVQLFGPFATAVTYEQQRLALRSFPRIYNSADVWTKERHEYLKDTFNEKIKPLLKVETKDELIAQFTATQTTVQTLFKMLRTVFIEINAYKRQNRLYEFADIARMALEIVSKNPRIADEIRSSFDEILVDEYQDTNTIQDSFIKAISQNNLYMVGDIKQSIYRFRKAEPSLFQNRYHEYNEGVTGIKIDLGTNFRSRPLVLQHINRLFTKAMQGGISEINYQQGHELYFGKTIYEEVGRVSTATGLEVHTYDLREQELPTIHGHQLNSTEYELNYVAHLIKEKIQSQMLILDKENLRPIRYSDMTILIDRSTHFNLCKRIFEAHGIPLQIFEDKSINESFIPKILIHLIQFITFIETPENYHFRYAFTSLARSFIFHLSDEEIFVALSDFNELLKTSVYRQLAPLSMARLTTPLPDLLNRLIEQSGLYEKLPTVGNIELHRHTIDYLLQMATAMANQGFNSDNFVIHLEHLSDLEKDITYPIQTDAAQGVRLMTIHKSKGLEFSVVFYPLLDKDYNFKELNDHVIFNDRLGMVSSHIVDGTYMRTFVHEILKESEKQKERAEKLRLWYVALTRAKESMIVILPYETQPQKAVDQHNSFADLMWSLKNEWVDLEKPIIYGSFSLINPFNRAGEKKLPAVSSTDVPLPVMQISMNPQNQEFERASKTSLEWVDVNRGEILATGTRLHYYLELLDFHHPSFEFISNNREQEMIRKFFQQPFMQQLQTPTFYKELPFSFDSGTETYQGIIDLLIVTPHEWLVIDYKTSQIDDPAYDRQLTIYYQYLKQKTTVPIRLILYSLTRFLYREIVPLPINF